MANRDILKVEPNSSVIVKLLYDNGIHQPATKAGYDDQWAWGVSISGAEYVIFATVKLNEMLLNDFKKDDMVLIGKAATEKGGQAYYVQAYDSNQPESVKPSEQLKPNTNGANTKAPEGYRAEKDAYQRLHNIKVAHSIAKSVALKLSVQSLDKWDEPEIIKRYQVLLTILNDDLDTVFLRLQNTTNVHHLEATWKKHAALWRAILLPEELGQAIDEAKRLKDAFNNPEPDKEVEKKEPLENFMPTDSEPLPF